MGLPRTEGAVNVNVNQQDKLYTLERFHLVPTDLPLSDVSASGTK